MNVKASASQTLARPELRELAPFSFADYAGGYLTSGNPTLTRSQIRNYDLRWEWFPGYRSVVAVSGFYKTFKNPIEVLVLPSTELIRSWVNAPEAENYGMEFELRSDLGFLFSGLRSLEFNGNLTLVESDVQAGGVSTVYIPNQGPLELTTIDRSRPLQGQSPYVVNLGLGWVRTDSDAKATLLFNRFGERIDAVGREQSPDIYEEARNQLDLVLERPFRGVEMKLALTRILGNTVEFTQGGETLRRYDLGRSVTLSLGWSPGW
jgi:outer membrane receptor protein involved in Fe transport